MDIRALGFLLPGLFKNNVTRELGLTPERLTFRRVIGARSKPTPPPLVVWLDADTRKENNLATFRGVKVRFFIGTPEERGELLTELPFSFYEDCDFSFPAEKAKDGAFAVVLNEDEEEIALLYIAHPEGDCGLHAGSFLRVILQSATVTGWGQ